MKKCVVSHNAGVIDTAPEAASMPSDLSKDLLAKEEELNEKERRLTAYPPTSDPIVLQKLAACLLEERSQLRLRWALILEDRKQANDRERVLLAAGGRMDRRTRA